MNPCVCVGGAGRAEERVVVYNCTQCDCMLRVSIGPSLLDGLQMLYILLEALGAGEVMKGFCKDCHCATQVQVYHHRKAHKIFRDRV